MERKLVAILAADLVGYTHHMGADELGTLERMTALRERVLDPLIAGHHGRIVKFMGDGLLVEFGSVVDAVGCAVAWQQGVARHEAEANDTQKFRFRIGINLGDVIIKDNDIFGDGVIIASRLEGLAAPGGICLSGDAYRQAKGKIGVTFEDIGAQELKNVSEPVRVYRILVDDYAEYASSAIRRALPLPNKPSIAVLPFVNMSGDPKQEFLADGMTEDLITALSKIRWFFVIARTSSFTYKGQLLNVTQVAQELGVRYVLEGSMRKAGDRVRITAELVDATTGGQVWAERYDRNIDDIFALQDEMTQTIVAAVDSEIGAVERERALRRPPESLDVWETFQRGLWHLWRFDAEDVAEAVQLFLKCDELDPDFAPPRAYEAYARYVNVVQGYAANPSEDLEKAFAAAKKAVSMDSKDAIAHFALGRVYTMWGRHDAAIAALEEALSLNPNLAQGYHALGMALMLSDQMERAIDSLDLAMRLSPRDPRVWATMVFRSLACTLMKKYETAAEWSRKAMRVPTDRGYWSNATLASALANLGQIEDARKAVQEALRRKPDLTLGYLEKTLLAKKPGALSPYLDGLRKAGLPE